MKKIILILILVLGLIPFVNAEMEIVEATNYHSTFSAAVADIELDKIKCEPGELINGNAVLVNKINHPLTEGKIGVMVRYHGDEPYQEYVVDWFYLDKEFNLDIGAKEPFTFKWTCPNSAKSGRYRFYFHFYMDDFTVGGANFVANYNIGFESIYVKNPGTQEFIRYDTKNIYVGKKQYDPTWVMDIEREQSEDLTVEVPLVNEGSTADISIDYQIYVWSDLKEKSIEELKAKGLVPAESYLDKEYKQTRNIKRQETISLGAGETKKLSWHLGKLMADAYSLQITATNKKTDQKAFLILRLPVKGKKAYIGVVTFENFPVKSGEEAKLLVMWPNPSASMSTMVKNADGSVTVERPSSYEPYTVESKLKIELFQNDNKIYSEEAKIWAFPMLQAAKFKFKASQDLSNVVVRTTIADDKTFWDIEETKFDSSKITEKVEPKLSIVATTGEHKVNYKVTFKSGIGQNLEGVVKVNLIKDGNEVSENVQKINGILEGSFDAEEGDYTLRVLEFTTKLEATTTASAKGFEKTEEQVNYLPWLILVLVIIIVVLIFTRKFKK